MERGLRVPISTGIAFGFAGAHRTGKTTLARVVSERTGLPIAETSSSAVFKQMGLDPRMDYGFDTRMQIQHRVLKALEDSYEMAKLRYPQGFITDRTPIDAAAYLMADVTRGLPLSDTQNTWVMDYLTECRLLSHRCFDSIVMIRPGIKVPESEANRADKAPSGDAYIAHLDALIFSYMMEWSAFSKVKNGESFMGYALGRQVLALDERVQYVESLIFMRRMSQSTNGPYSQSYI